MLLRKVFHFVPKRFTVCRLGILLVERCTLSIFLAQLTVQLLLIL